MISPGKNLIHGRETATILKFSALIFETYFNKTWARWFSSYLDDSLLII